MFLKKLIINLFGYEAVNYIKVLVSFFQSWKMFFYLKQLQEEKKNDLFEPLDTVLLPLIETGHYAILQLLIVAKGMQLRGYKIVVIICDASLLACESRPNKINSSYSACLNCNLNIKLIKLFGFEIEKLSDFQFDNFNILEINKIIPTYLGALKDSVNRHFYGDLPLDKTKIHSVEKNTLIHSQKYKQQQLKFLKNINLKFYLLIC